MKAIPLSPSEALAQVNLPADLANNPVFKSHTPLVMTQLQSYSTADAWEEATADLSELITPLNTEPEPETEPTEPDYTQLQIQFRACFAFLLLASTAEFLNLKTVGEGIVKTIGLDNSATSLLSGHEIEAFANRLTRRALLAIEPWLSPLGYSVLADLSPDAPKKIKVSLL